MPFKTYAGEMMITISLREVENLRAIEAAATHSRVTSHWDTMVALPKHLCALCEALDRKDVQEQYNNVSFGDALSDDVLQAIDAAVEARINHISECLVRLEQAVPNNCVSCQKQPPENQGPTCCDCGKPVSLDLTSRTSRKPRHFSGGGASRRDDERGRAEGRRCC